MLVDGVVSIPASDAFVRLDEVFVLSVREIASTKAYIIGRRGSFKDYVDLYFVLAGAHASLGEVIDLAERKYGDGFNSQIFLLEQIVAFDDLEDTNIKFLDQLASRKMLRNPSREA
jgi:hypothetical protein